MFADTADSRVYSRSSTYLDDEAAALQKGNLVTVVELKVLNEEIMNLVMTVEMKITLY